MSQFLKFICPKCGGQILKEEMDAIVVSEIFIDREGEIDYGRVENFDGEVIGYSCGSCAQYLRNEQGRTLSSNEDLYEYLLLQPYNKATLSTEDSVE